MRRLLVLGAGGHAKVVAATAQAAGYDEIRFFDDNPTRWGEEILGCRVEGAIEAAHALEGERIVAIGDNRLRLQLARRISATWSTLIHPTACVHPSVVLGEGTVVMAGAVIQPDTRIEAHVVVNTGASVDHDCEIGAGAHIAPGARLAGGVKLGDGVLFGIGAVAIPGISVGEWAIVGAGAAVVTNVTQGETVVGVPARPSRAGSPSETALISGGRG